MDQPGTIDNPANRENENIPVSVRGREFDLARRVRPSRPASACSFSILRLNLVLIHGIPLAFHDSVHIYIYIYIPSTAIGSIPSVSGHSIAYRWRSLSRVRRHRASNGWCCLFRLHHGPTCMRLSFLTPQVFRRVWGRAHPQEMQPTGCLCDSIIQPAG